MRHDSRPWWLHNQPVRSKHICAGHPDLEVQYHMAQITLDRRIGGGDHWICALELRYTIWAAADPLLPQQQQGETCLCII